MKTKKRILQIATFFVIALFTACSGNQKKVHDHNTTDTKSEVMPDQHHNDDTTGTHIQHTKHYLLYTSEASDDQQRLYLTCLHFLHQ